MADTINLPDHLIRQAEQMALGNVLSDWNDLSYDEVVSILDAEGEDNFYTGVRDERIMMWEPFENYPPSFILEQLDSFRREFLSAMQAGYTSSPLTTDEQAVLGDLLFYTERNCDNDEDMSLYRGIANKLFNQTEEV